MFSASVAVAVAVAVAVVRRTVGAVTVVRRTVAAVAATGTVQEPTLREGPSPITAGERLHPLTGGQASRRRAG